MILMNGLDLRLLRPMSSCFQEMCLIRMLPLAICLLSFLLPNRELLAQAQLIEHSTPTRHWVVEFGGDIGSLSVHGQHALVGAMSADGTQTELVCLALSDGTKKWSLSFPRLAQGFLDNRAIGLRGPPKVVGDQVLFWNNRAEIVCADLEGTHDNKDDGIKDSTFSSNNHADIIWSLDLRNELDVFKRDIAGTGSSAPSPTIFEDSMIFATGNASTRGISRFFSNREFVPQPTAPWVVRVSIKNGKVIWQNSDASNAILHSAIVTPHLIHRETDESTQQLVGVSPDGAVCGINPITGETIWSYASKNPIWTWIPPIVSKERVFVFESHLPGKLDRKRPYKILSFDKSRLFENGDRKPEWIKVDEAYSGTMVPPLVVNNILFVIASNGNLIAMDPTNGDIYWTDELEYEANDFPKLLAYGSQLAVPIGDKLLFYDAQQEKRPICTINIGYSIKHHVPVQKLNSILVSGRNSVSLFSLKNVFPQH